MVWNILDFKRGQGYRRMAGGNNEQNILSRWQIYRQTELSVESSPAVVFSSASLLEDATVLFEFDEVFLYLAEKCFLYPAEK